MTIERMYRNVSKAWAKRAKAVTMAHLNAVVEVWPVLMLGDAERLRAAQDARKREALRG